MNSMSKKSTANQSLKKISPLLLTLAAIASVISAIIFYVLITLAFGALENSNASEGLQVILFIALLFAVLLAPSIIVAAIVVPIIKRNNKQ